MSNLPGQTPPINIPTLAELNSLGAGNVSLLLLRILNTSDLAFFHGLFKSATLSDILSVTDQMVAIDSDFGVFTAAKEYLHEREQIQDEIEAQIARGD